MTERRAILVMMALPLVAACAVPPTGVPADADAAYESAVASIGCNMRTERDYLPVEIQTGMTREQVIKMTEYKIATKKAVKDPDGGVKLMTGACA